MCKSIILSPRWAHTALLWKKVLKIQELWHFPSEGGKKKTQLFFCTSPVICTILCMSFYVTLSCLHTHLWKPWWPPPASLASSNHLEMQKWPRIFSYISSQGGGEKISSLSQRRKIRSAIWLSAILSLSRKWVLHFLLAKLDSCTLELRHNLTLNPDWCAVFRTAYLFGTCTVSDHICW